MEAGKLRHRVTIQKRSRAQDPSGEESDVFTAIAEVWASVEPLTGREQFTAQQILSEVTHRIRMRYIPGITVSARDRIVYGTRLFDIQFPANLEERNKELEITAKEVFV